MPRTDSTYYGRVAYEAFRESQNWMDETGKELLDFDTLVESEQQAWVAGGLAVVKAYTGES